MDSQTFKYKLQGKHKCSNPNRGEHYAYKRDMQRTQDGLVCRICYEQHYEGSSEFLNWLTTDVALRIQEIKIGIRREQQ